MIASSLKPTLADGFTNLDVELAGLLSRHLESEGFDESLLDVQWWCAAAALASRALADGHVCLDLSDPVLHSEGGGLTPVDPNQANALRSFVHRFDLHRAALRNSSDHGDPGDQHERSGQALAKAVRASGLLVVEHDRVYLRRQWAAERRVARALAERAQFTTPLSSEDLRRAQSWLEHWFAAGEGASSQDQQQACLQGAQSRLTVITGGPGTGKTYTAARLIALAQALRPAGAPWLRVALAAPTGKAAARLRQALDQAWSTLQGAGLPAAFWEGAWSAIQVPRTLHALLGQWQRDHRAGPRLVNPSSQTASNTPASFGPDLLVVDEASMLDLDLLDELLQALPPNARLVLIGDRNQLASVAAGSVMADVCHGLSAHPALVPLHASRRFQGRIAQWARGLQSHDPAVLKEIQQEAHTSLGDLVAQASGPDGWAPFVRAWAALRPPTPSTLGAGQDGPTDEQLGSVLERLDQFRVLAPTRLGPWGVESLNARVEAALAAQGLMEIDQPWPNGRVLMVTRNDEPTGLRNGDVGVVLAGRSRSPQFIWLAGQVVRRIGVVRLPPTEPAYAMTVHKSQGSEFHRVFLALPDTDSPVLSRELLYTGLTRARSELQWFIPAPALLNLATTRSTRRMSGLGERLRAELESEAAGGQGALRGAGHAMQA